jgi:FkbM family methyltransferase
MHTLERLCTSLRHSPRLRDAEWLWDQLRSPYTALLATLAQNGLERVINGTDVIRLTPEYRAITENYEPEVWKRVMDEVRIGDVVADVGANIGLYAIALAKRVGDSGKVHAFEPDPANFRVLDRHCRLNQVTARVIPYQVAVTGADGHVAFETGRGCESHISSNARVSKVDGVRLDSVFAGDRIDILKIDVEGFEESVLNGASELLRDRVRGPRIIYIEVHPFVWEEVRTTSETLLKLLTDNGYRVEDLSGKVVVHVEAYGEIIARRREC